MQIETNLQSSVIVLPPHVAEGLSQRTAALLTAAKKAVADALQRLKQFFSSVCYMFQRGVLFTYSVTLNFYYL